MWEHRQKVSFKLSYLKKAWCGLWLIKAGDYSGPLAPTGHLSLWGDGCPWLGLKAPLWWGLPRYHSWQSSRLSQQALERPSAGIQCASWASARYLWWSLWTSDEDPPLMMAGLAVTSRFPL